MKPVTKQAVRLMHEGALALAEIENNGVRVDVGYVKQQQKEVGAKIEDMKKQLRSDKVYKVWRKVKGGKVTIGSKEQLEHIIFDVMGYPRNTKVTKKKARSEEGNVGKRESTHDEIAFSHLFKEVPFLALFFQCEKLKKLKSTYFDGLMNEVIDGFVHPTYNLHTVVSYRSSCSEPNFQNVPVRNPEVAQLARRCYIPRKGRHVVEVDFGQLEVRAAAFDCLDPKLIKYCSDPTTDMHRDMAMKLFMLTEKQVGKKTTRDWTKNRFVFPQFYGSVYFQCAPDLWQGVLSGAKVEGEDITILEHLRRKGIKELGDCDPNAELKKGTFVAQVKAAEDYLWNETFTVYTKWKKRAWEEYLKTGGFNLLSGFKCEGLFKRNDVLNYRTQGVAFHCELQCLIWLIKEMKRLKMKSLMIGEIHDSDQADVVPSELQDYLSLSHEIKTRRLPKEWKFINVPLEVEMEVCDIDAPWSDKRVWIQEGRTWKRKS